MLAVVEVLDPAPGPAGELPGGLRGTAHDSADGVERNGEHVVEDEGHALLGRHRIEHDQQGRADRLGQDDRLRRVSFGHRLVDVGDVVSEEVLGSGTAGPQAVETDPPRHGREPPGDVLDSRRVTAKDPQPRLLDGVLCLRPGSEHPVRHALEARSVRLELLCHPLLVVHQIVLGSQTHMSMTCGVGVV
jgi:hypothetical protein